MTDQGARSITVNVGKDGRITAETHGIKGAPCTDYIAALEDLLDAVTTDSEYTSEFNEDSSYEKEYQGHELHTDS